MNGRRIEHRHHTDEQVWDIIARAVELVVQQEIPKGLREAAFQTAANLYAQKSIVQEQVSLGVPAMTIPGKL